MVFRISRASGGVVGGDDAVGHFPGEEGGRLLVTGVGQGHPVAIGAHPVGAAGAGIGAGHIRQLQIVHEVDLFEGIGQGQGHRRAGGADMLEGSGRRQAGRLFQLLDQLPAIEARPKN